jgi:diguanylate cyclase (GGDEF)-like protein
LPIRTLFLVCMSALATMAGALGLLLLAHSLSQYRFATRVERAVEVGSLLFTVADRLSAMIPTVGQLLFDDAAADQAALRRVADAQRAFDQSAMLARTRIAAARSPETARQLAIIGAVQADRPPWQTRAAAQLALPRAARDPVFWEQYILGFDPMFEALDSVLDLGDTAAEHEDGLTLDLLDLARQSWLPRVLMGDRSGPVVGRISDSRALDAGLLERIAQANGRLVMRWATIDGLGRRLPAMAGLSDAIAAAHASAAEFDALHGRVVEAGRRGGVYPIAARDYGEHSSATGKMIVKIRDAALRIALTRAAQTRRGAAISVAAVAAALLAIAAGSFVALALLARRIVSPLLSMTHVIERLAERDFAVSIPAVTRSDEIGGLATALEALRQSAIAADHAEARISHMARHDPLTGLANRVLLQEHLERAVMLTGRGNNCAALCIDLDRFKAVNDTFGHPTGDKLLQAVAERLLACARETDVVVRLGGDEFAVLIGELEEPGGAAVLAQRIIRVLCEPFNLDGQTVGIGASVGIALAPQDARTAVGLLKSADTALYRAKIDGRGLFRYFEPDMDTRLQARFEMERDLRQAIDDKRLELVYQPLYTVEKNELCAFEALLRWRHPRHGLIAPGEFIPLAEETGLIVPIGRWVLRRACAEAANWPDNVKLAVNLSAVQFRSKQLVATVSDALADAGLPAARLELEITESLLLQHGAETLATLHALRALGASISMDDFGTGYSSLSYLRSFPFDKIKIDQSFVRDLGEDEESRAIVRAVIGLGRSLGMATTAEGVETQAQLAELRREGCTQVQGFLLGRPVSAAAAREMVGETVPAVVQ